MTKKEFVMQHLKHLHDVQLNMIDEALEKSDLKEAKELIEYIMKKEPK